MSSKSILVGMLLSDGSVRNIPRCRRIVFANKSNILCNIFKDNVIKNYGKQHFQEYLDKYDVRIVTVSNKKIVDDLLCICNSFRTKSYGANLYPEVHLPKIFWEINQSELAKVFRVIFSCDGSVSLGIKWHKRFNNWVLTRKVALTCKHPVLIKEYQKLLKEKFDLNFKLNKYELVLENKYEIIKFKKHIAFIKGVKVSKKSKNWEGFEKNYILDLLIKTYKISQSFCRKFKTKEEILRFLKTL